ncbi:MAG TPA: response regulator [Gammaproteobacteria bacterium]|jgi:CheY-like chemotaxis protein|nr:response regulator [Gammaproteobacteria bacterium]
MSEYKQVEILYAEDNPADAELTLYTLKTRNIANHIVWVRDGVEVLDFLKYRGRYAGRTQSMPKMILLDLKMPKMDGIDVLRVLKADPETQGIPVVIMTSSHEESDLIRSYKLGVNSYIVKPVDFDNFAKMVSEVGLYWMLSNKVPG